MNWIGTWCKQRCELEKNCDECYEICTPRIGIANAVKCQEHLIWILMNQRGGVTHPNIANAIANYIGATEEERDSIVAPIHRGTWKPDPKKKNAARSRLYSSQCALPVVAVDRLGRVLRRFPSIRLAAAHIGCSTDVVAKRCHCVDMNKDEFVPYGMTFRFEPDWDMLSDAERRENIRKRSERFGFSQP